MRDFTNMFNTYLPPEQEAMFDAWLANESVRQGRDVRNDMYDYDLKGMWAESDAFGGDNGHGTDKHKKPNHPTFSDQSKYHGACFLFARHTANSFVNALGSLLLHLVCAMQVYIESR